METPVIFISAATVDLQVWRTHLHTAFSRAGFRVRTQNESLASAPGNVRRLLADTIEECDCIIHLAGLGYGSHAQAPFPEDPAFQCSWTHFEYYHAHATGKGVIAFVCAPELSKPNFQEEGTESERVHKQRLQTEHRARVASGEFDGTPLAGHMERTCNETVTSAQNLLEAVASAVGTLHRLDESTRAQARQELGELSVALSRVEQTQAAMRHEARSATAHLLKYGRWIVGLIIAGFVLKYALDRKASDRVSEQISTSTQEVTTTAQQTQASVTASRDQMLQRLDASSRLVSSMISDQIYQSVSVSSGLTPGLLRQLASQSDDQGGFRAFAAKLKVEGRGIEGRALLQIIGENEFVKPAPNFAIAAAAFNAAAADAHEEGALADARWLYRRGADAIASVPEAALSQALRLDAAVDFLTVLTESYVEDAAATSDLAAADLQKNAETIIALSQNAPHIRASAQLILANLWRTDDSSEKQTKAAALCDLVEKASLNDAKLATMNDSIRASLTCEALLLLEKPDPGGFRESLTKLEEIALRPGIPADEKERAVNLLALNAGRFSERLDPKERMELLSSALEQIDRIEAIPSHNRKPSWQRCRALLRVAELRLKLAQAHEYDLLFRASGKDLQNLAREAQSASLAYNEVRQLFNRKNFPASWAMAQRGYASALKIMIDKAIETHQRTATQNLALAPVPYAKSPFGISSQDLKARGIASSKQRLEQRENLPITNQIMQALEACGHALEIWTAENNPLMHGQLLYETGGLLSRQAEIAPAAQAQETYQAAITQFGKAAAIFTRVGNKSGSSQAERAVYLAEMGLKIFQDLDSHAQGLKTPEELRSVEQLRNLLGK